MTIATRKKIYSSIPALLLAACAMDVPTDDPEIGSVRQSVLCGAQTWTDVERYNGGTGIDNTSGEFVKRHEPQVGMVRFNATFPANYTAPLANPGTNNPLDWWCTGTLIAPDLFITAGHCFDPDTSFPTDATGTQLTGIQTAQSDMEVVFNFQIDPATGNPRPGVAFDILSVQEHRLGGHDYAIVQLAGNPGNTYGWARMAAVTPRRGDDLTIIQHPGGIPKVVDSGSVLSTHATFTGEVQYDNIDTQAGSSGSGVLDWQGRLIAIHQGAAAGACTAGVAGNHATLIETIVPDSPLIGGLLREVGDHSEVLAAGDFNGDFYNDVVVGVPTRNVGGAEAAGAVRILYGSANGPVVATQQWINQDTPNVDGLAEGGDFFGAAVTVGYFNGDRFADLAVGAPGEDSFATGTQNAGGVWIFYGSATGLATAGSTSFDQEDANLAEVSENEDRMGSALAAGDFNKDGLMDVAVGSPGETVGAVAGSGAVTVLYGSVPGITSTGNQHWDQTAAIGAAESEANDRFGSALASADFDNDGYKDLAIGAPYEDLSNPVVIDAGSVSVLYGSATKLKTRANNRFFQGTVGGLEGVLERGDRVGTSLAAGDLNGDGRGDLVVGAPGEDIGSNMHAGYIHAIYGSATGLTSVGDVGISEDTASVPGNPESEDRFGMSVSVAQLGHPTTVSKAEDVLVGAPGEIIGTSSNAGWIIELFGRQSAVLSGTDSKGFSQAPAVVPDEPEMGDRLGTVVLAKDVNLDGYAEALISPPGEDLNAPPVAVPQALQLLFGSSTGLTTNNNVLLP